MDYHWSLNVFKLVEILVGGDGPIEIDGLPNWTIVIFYSELLNL